MARKVGHIVGDLLETIERLETKTADRTYAEFASDWELRFIVERGIEVISEATRHLPDEIKAIRPEIEWRSIAGIGNILRHEYHAISSKIIWDVVKSELPQLKAAIQAIAASEVMAIWARLTITTAFTRRSDVKARFASPALLTILRRCRLPACQLR